MDVPSTPPAWRRILRDDPAPLWLMADLPTLDGYPHWDDLRTHIPPEDLTHEQWWVRLKALRLERAVKLPLTSAAGKQFWYTMPALLRDAISRLTPAVTGEDVELGEQVSRAASERDMFVEWTLREEAIASAQLAGIGISRSAALLRFDNGTLTDTADGTEVWRLYEAMSRVHELACEPLAPERIRELNALLTGDGTLRSSSRAVADPRGRIWHAAPEASEVPARLKAMCDFANDPPEDMPRLLAAVAVHYAAVNDQYFARANNRTARLLFYWTMCRNGYWLARYLSVSKVMAARGVDYRRTFLLSDSDDGDLTYFFDFSASVLRRAIWQLRARLEAELRASTHTRTPLLDVEHELNHRQLKVLEACLAEGRSTFSYETHEVFWGVTFETARDDLRSLGTKGLLVRKENSRVWQAPPDLSARLRGDAPKTVSLGDPTQPRDTDPHEEGTMHKLWRFVRGMQPGH